MREVKVGRAEEEEEEEEEEGLFKANWGLRAEFARGDRLR